MHWITETDPCRYLEKLEQIFLFLKFLIMPLKDNIHLSSSRSFVIMFMAVIRCRATAAPLNSTYMAEEFDFYLSDSESKLLLTPQEGNQSAQVGASKLNIPHVTAALPSPNSNITLFDHTGPESGTIFENYQ